MDTKPMLVRLDNRCILMLLYCIVVVVLLLLLLLLLWIYVLHLQSISGYRSFLESKKQGSSCFPRSFVTTTKCIPFMKSRLLWLRQLQSSRSCFDLKSFSPKTPSGILQRADSIWLAKQPQYNYGGSYRSPTPSKYYTQMFGREVCFANGSAGLTALQALYSGNHNGPLPKSSSNDSCFDDPLHSILNCTDESSESRSFQPTLSQLSELSPNTCLTPSPTT